MKLSTGLSRVGRFFCLFVMMVLLVAPGASAGTFDATAIGSKELSKAKRLSTQFAKQVDQADTFVQKNNLSMAGKRLTNADRTYNKIIAPYRLHPEVLVNKTRFDELQAKVTEAKAVADLEKSVQTFDKKVAEAQKYLDRKDTKNCERFLEKALASYEAIPAAHRDRADVQAIHARYDAIVATTGASVKSTATASAAKASVDSGETYGLDSKTLKKAKRYASRFEKKMAEADRFFQEKDYAICERRLIDANKLYVKIGPEYQQDPGVQATKKAYDEMNAVVTQAVTARKEGIEKKTQMLRLRSSFESEVRNQSRILSYLQNGRDKKATSLEDVQRFLENFEALDTFNAACQEKYKLLLEQVPDREVEGETVKTIFDLAENRIAYRNALIEVSINKALDSLIEDFAEVNTKILEKNQARGAILDSLSNENFGEHLFAIQKTRAICKATGTPLPTEKILAVKAFGPTLKDSIQSVRNNLKFKKSDYPYQTSAMKRVAAKTADAKNMKLMYVGMEGEHWQVIKNDLGIPLRKIASGRGLYHVKGENFYRSCSVKIIREFNGSGYEPISMARPDYLVTIYKK